MRSTHRCLFVAAPLLLAACGGASVSSGGRVADAEGLRQRLSGKDAQTLAPQAYALAERELQLAKEADRRGDGTSAELYGERALASFQRAIALARLARATQDDGAASEGLARAKEEASRYATQRAALEREGAELEKQLRIAQEAQLPAPSGPAEPDRERARFVAAQALVTQARLLCSAARLVSPQAPGLDEAERVLADLEKKVAAPPAGGRSAKAPAPIDAAARARAACLTSLTKARRGTDGADGAADALLSELSSSVASLPAEARKPAEKLEVVPARDERGVVVTVRAAFAGEKLSPSGEAVVKDLGRVAAAHPSFGVQVVFHDAQAPSTGEKEANVRRAEAVTRALIEGGAKAASIRVEQAEARSPVVDPQDAKRRERNARLEVVFVTPST